MLFSFRAIQRIFPRVRGAFVAKSLGLCRVTACVGLCGHLARRARCVEENPLFRKRQIARNRLSPGKGRSFSV
eukprot:15447589-Alexandrium_andersonii.AAC.1